jgi:hypothetical protein
MANRKDKDDAGAGTAVAEQPQQQPDDAAATVSTATAQTGQALTAPNKQEVATTDSQYVDHTLLHNDVAIAEAIEAAQAMEMSFVTYTKPEQIFAMSQDGARFMITDVVTVNINDTDPKATSPTKAVHVFKLETIEPAESSGMEYFTMLGTNPVRDRIADGFFKNRLLGIRLTAGPVKFGQIKVAKWPSPAWTLESVKGFRIARA